MQWLQMHYNDLLAILGGAVIIVSIVVKLTATQNSQQVIVVHL